MSPHPLLLLQLLPVAALVLLLASGRVGAPSACLLAMVLALPAALAGPASGRLPAFLADALAAGLYLSIVPMGIMLGGLVFHAATLRPERDSRASDPLFGTTFLLGPFAETVTGFGVGVVFAIGRLRAAGVAGPPAAALGAITLTLIPWGGLGPGTAVGAVLADVPGQALAARNAVMLAASLPLLLPVFWRCCRLAGQPVPGRRKLGQLGWVAALGLLLVALHRVAPWEVCGVLASGAVLVAWLLASAPPRGLDAWRDAVAAAAPYALLVAALLAGRAWTAAPAWHPLADLPPLPLSHAMVALWLVSLLLAARHQAPLRLLRGTLGRGRRPALTLMAFVVLARLLTEAGIPQGLATALAGAFGAAAPYASPLLAGAAGFVGGTNVASNSAMMPLQAALGRIAGLDPIVLPAVQNGTLFLLLSPQLAAIAGGLAGAAARDIWRILWPIAIISLAVGGVSVWLG